MASTRKTLEDLLSTKVEFLLVRCIQTNEVDDLDILVKKKSFDDAISALDGVGYKSFSHDGALGGRIAGAQMNLIKKGRIKIDLHKDFTWRGQRYLDTNILWKSKKTKIVSGVKVSAPDEILDVFLIIINIIFEKTYIVEEHVLIDEYIQKIERDERVGKQSGKHCYKKTLEHFINWFKNTKDSDKPIFLPSWLVMYSYWEKLLKERSFDLTSFAYYFFFRTRYFFNKRLPYD